MITTLLLLLSTCLFLFFSLVFSKIDSGKTKVQTFNYYYFILIIFSVIVTTICLSCEYRLINLYANFNVEASSIFFPLILGASTLMQSHFGTRANLILIGFVIGSTIIFSILLIAIIMLPSPSYFNLTLFYKTIMPEQMLSNACGFIIVLLSNAGILSLLKYPKHFTIPIWIRFLLANVISIMLLWYFNTLVLFPAIYPSDLISMLALDGFTYKLIVILGMLPLLLYLNRVLKNQAIIIR